jgi:hypothetical protein
MVVVQHLNPKLPPEFVAEPRVHLGSAFEIDVVAYEQPSAEPWKASSGKHQAGVATTAWSPAPPTLVLDTGLPVPPEYEVLVFDVSRRRRLVAAVEIVSPGNKDLPESRRAFVAKCEGLLHQGVCVVIVDLVTIRAANLYRELAQAIGAAAPTVSGPIYVVGCRRSRQQDRLRVQAWQHELVIGQPLPTLPLWISNERYVPLELEETYEETCLTLRIA